MSEATSALTFEDLILEVSRKIGLAYYGADGDGSIRIPVDPHDLIECKRHVNNAIRMFVSDSPASGWRWQRQMMSVTLWGSVATDADNTVSSTGYNPTTDKTTLQAESDSFYESMEYKSIVITGVGTFTITDYVSADTIRVSGDASTAAAATWAITADGNYTLPRTFGGDFKPQITYAAGTNQGIDLSWTDESTIRQWREDTSDDSGDPWLVAIRPMSAGSPRRRWELVTYPAPNDVLTVLIPYTIHFDKLVDLDETPPTPIGHDDTIKAACLATVEKDVEDVQGPNWAYYRDIALQNSYRLDGLSAPKRLGYVGDGRSRASMNPRYFRNHIYDRPNVTFNP
jgi:hypothetical protein